MAGTEMLIVWNTCDMHKVPKKQVTQVETKIKMKQIQQIKERNQKKMAKTTKKSVNTKMEMDKSCKSCKRFKSSKSDEEVSTSFYLINSSWEAIGSPTVIQVSITAD